MAVRSFRLLRIWTGWVLGLINNKSFKHTKALCRRKSFLNGDGGEWIMGRDGTRVWRWSRNHSATSVR